MQIPPIFLISSEKEFAEKSIILFEGYSKILILTDSHVAEHCLTSLIAMAPKLADAEVLEVDPGEGSKSVDVSIHLWTHLAELNADRNTLLINFGGGMITDLGGWIASTYKRGIPFIHIPTTVVAMGDAAIGGKTGIDHGGFKNMIGTFTNPECTLIYTGFLKSLPAVERRAGFAEIIKTGLVADLEVWNLAKDLEPEETDELTDIIHKTAMIKQKITEQDFRETGLRKILNFGHTIGHALESYFIERSTPVAHGIAVGLGMICETRLSAEVNNLDAAVSREIIDHLSWIYNPTEFELPVFGELKRYLLQDKKTHNNQLMFVLLDKPGKASFNHPISLDIIELHYNLSLLHINE